MAKQETIHLTPGAIGLAELRRILRDGAGIELAADVVENTRNRYIEAFQILTGSDPELP